MTSRTKLYRQRKYIFIVTSLLLFYTLFLRLGQLVYSVIKLKANGFTVKSITFDSEIDDSCQVSVASTVTCPINFELSDIKTTVQIEFENRSVQLAEIGCTNIKVSKFDSLAFNAAVTLRNLDLSELSDMFSARELTVNLQMTLQVRFLLLPLAFAVRSTVFRFDPNRKTDVGCQSAEDFSTRKIPIGGELHEDINRILGWEVLKELSVEKVMMGSKESFVLRVRFTPLITSKHAERYSINLKNHVITFKKPTSCTVTVKSLVASSSTYEMTLLIPVVSGQSFLSELLVSLWARGNCELEVSAIEIWKDGAYVTRYQAVDSKGQLAIRLPFSGISERKPSLMHMQFKGFRIEENSLSCDLVCRNETWLIVLRRMMCSAFGDRKLCGLLKVNGAELCRLTLGMNEMPGVLSLDACENAILKCTAEFDDSSRMILRSGKVIEEASVKFESSPLFADGVEVGFCPEHSAFLAVNGKRIPHKGTGVLIASNSNGILLEHEWIDSEDLLLCMKSELKNGASFRNDYSHLRVDLEDIGLRLLSRKLDIEIDIQELSFGAQFQPHREKDVVFSRGSFVTRLKERSDVPTESSTDLISYIIGSDILLFIGESIQVPIQIIEGDSNAYRLYKDLSVKYIPTHNVATHVLEMSSISSSLQDMLAAHDLDIFTHGPMTIENRFKCGEVLLQSLSTFRLSVAEMTFSIVWLDGSICLYFPCPASVVLEFHPQDNQGQYMSGLVRFALGLVAVKNSFGQGDDVADNTSCVIDKSINANIALEDTSQALDFSFCVDFPTECTMLNEGLRLSLPNDFKLAILDEHTSKEVLELSLRFSFARELLRSHLRLKGLVTSGLDRLVVIYSVGDGSACRLNTSIHSIREFLIAASSDIASMVGLLFHSTEADGYKQVNTAQNILHIEPRGQFCRNSSLDLDFGICSEALNEFVSQKIASIVGSLPLETRPRYLVLNVDASRLPSFDQIFPSLQKSEPGIHASLSSLSLRGRDLRFELEYEKKEHRSMTAEEVRVHNRPILERMYGPKWQSEIEYYEKHYGSEILKDDIFDKFLGFHMQLGIVDIWNRENAVKQFPTTKSMHSNILAIYNYLQGEEYSLFSGLHSHGELSQSRNEFHLLSYPKIWSDENMCGVFAARCMNRINIVGSPFSMFFTFEGIICLHVRLFGLLSDPYLDSQSSNLAIPYCIHNRFFSSKLTAGYRQFKLYTLCGRYISCLRFSAGNTNKWYINYLTAHAYILYFYFIPVRMLMHPIEKAFKYFVKWMGSDLVKEVSNWPIIEGNIKVLVKLDKELMKEEYEFMASRRI